MWFKDIPPSPENLLLFMQNVNDPHSKRAAESEILHNLAAIRINDIYCWPVNEIAVNDPSTNHQAVVFAFMEGQHP